MVLNSNVISNGVANSDDSESPATKMVVNTTDFTSADLEEFVDVSQRIERVTRERRSQSKRSNSTILPATKIREELFQSISIDNDDFLHAMEHQTSYDTEKTESLIKCFDEDAQAVAKSLANKTPKGKVASVVASFRNRYGSTSSASSKGKKEQNNIQKLRKKYELMPEEETTASPKAVRVNSPRLTRKNKVKQIALLFNQKVNQIVRNAAPEQKTDEPALLDSESLASANFTTTLKPKSPKLTSKLPTFITRLASPKPSPFFKRKSLKKTANSPLVKRKNFVNQRSVTCLVAENAFSQLSVKDKIMLYNKFIEDMSKQNPKFQKHAEALESNVRKEVQRGEVVIEKQNSVKYIRDSIEAKLTPIKPASKTLPRCKRTPSSVLGSASKDSLQSDDCTPLPLAADSVDSLHYSRLTVVLKPTPDKKKTLKKIKAQAKKKKDVSSNASVVESTSKRTQNMIRCSFPVEPLAPPKKIRRTLNERLTPTFFFQNQDLEKLFFNWLTEKNGVAFDITPIDNKEDCIEIMCRNSGDNVLPQKEIEKILEAAVTKLEEERQDNNPGAAAQDDAVILIKNTIDDKKFMEKSIIEVELPLEVAIPNQVETMENETEDLNLGLTRLNKTTSEESQTELQYLEISTSATKHCRKKKLRRALILKTNTTDSSDSESKMAQTKQQQSSTLPKSKKCANYVKKLIFQTLHCSSGEAAETDCSPELSVELDDSLMKQANSPSKIKDAYTLTIISSPSPPSESDFYDSDLASTHNQQFSRSWPTLQEAEAIENATLMSVNNESKESVVIPTNKLMADSFIDQGFETGTTDMDSPLRVTKLRHYDSLSQEEKPINFSTPLKNRQELTSHIDSGNQSILSPISNCGAASLKMTTIREDNTLEYSAELHCPPSSLNESAISSGIEHRFAQQTLKVGSSQFWISSGNFTAALPIDHYESDKLTILSSIFIQQTMETPDMCFGIDDEIFICDNSIATNDIINKVPRVDNRSQYWFATGNVLLPFTGRLLNTPKIHSFFNYIRQFMDDRTSLRFGIDAFEFSYILDHISLLQSSTTPVKISDLDQSDLETEENEQSRIVSALNGQQAKNVCLKSDELLNVKTNESNCMEACDALKQIFDDAKLLNVSKTQTDQSDSETQFVIPEIKKTLQKQKNSLKTVAERMQKCNVNKAAPRLMPINISSEYMRKLRSIIVAIDNIGQGGNGFNDCSIDQLESFLFFLSHYSDLCLTSCSAHIEKILDVVSTQLSSMDG